MRTLRVRRKEEDGMRVRAFKLDGGSVLLVGDPERATITFGHEFAQGGCPLRLARDLELLAVKIREAAHQMGATQDGGW